MLYYWFRRAYNGNRTSFGSESAKKKNKSWGIMNLVRAISVTKIEYNDQQWPCTIIFSVVVTINDWALSYTAGSTAAQDTFMVAYHQLSNKREQWQVNYPHASASNTGSQYNDDPYFHDYNDRPGELHAWQLMEAFKRQKVITVGVWFSNTIFWEVAG